MTGDWTSKTPKHGASAARSMLRASAHVVDIFPLGIFACLPSLCDPEANVDDFRFIV